jgi:hypothetical protein
MVFLRMVSDIPMERDSQRAGVVQDRVGQRDLATKELLTEFHTWQKQLLQPSLDEAIRLIESEKAEKLTGQHIHRIAEYDAIEIDGECFFDKAFSSGKEVAACLAFAMVIGWREVLADLRRFRLTVLGPGCGGVSA